METWARTMPTAPTDALDYIAFEAWRAHAAGPWEAWYPTRHPYPRPATIARRMGVSARTVQRALGRLPELGLVGRLKDNSADAGGPVSTAFRLTGLVHEREPLACEDIAYWLRGTALTLGRILDGKAGSAA